VRLAPFGHDVPVPHDDTRLVAARLERSDRLAVGFPPETQVVVSLQIARRLSLTAAGEFDGPRQLERVHPHVLRPTSFPVVALSRVVNGILRAGDCTLDNRCAVLSQHHRRDQQGPQNRQARAQGKLRHLSHGHSII
jgi:hypothetical protein